MKYISINPDLPLLRKYPGIKYRKTGKSRASKVPIFHDYPAIEESLYNTISDICTDFNIFDQISNLCWFIHQANPFAPNELFDYPKHKNPVRNTINTYLDIIKLFEFFEKTDIELKLSVSNYNDNIIIHDQHLLKEMVNSYLEKHKGNLDHYYDYIETLKDKKGDIKKIKYFTTYLKIKHGRVLFDFLSHNTVGLTQGNKYELTGYILHYMGLPFYDREKKIISEYPKNRVNRNDDLVQHVKKLEVN